MKTPIQKRIEAGVAYLNVVRPKWLKKINLDELNMSNGKVCILGEVFGNYYKSSNELYLKGSVECLGFFCENEKEYPTLTRAWKKKIKELRGE